MADARSDQVTGGALGGGTGARAGPRPRPIRIAARDIEKAIIESLQRVVDDHAQLTMLYPQHDSEAYETADLLRSAALLHQTLSTMSPSDQRALLLNLELRAIVHADRIEAKISRVGLGQRLGIANLDLDGVPIELDIPTLMVRRGTDVKLTIQFDASASSARRDSKLVELLVKAHQAKRQLGLDGRAPTVDPHLDPYARKHLARLARFAFLAPEITTSIMEGSQPAGLSARKLIRCSDLPTDWKQQKHMLGFS